MAEAKAGSDQPRGLAPAVVLVGYFLAVLIPLGVAAAYEPRHQLLYREIAAGLALVGFVMLPLQFLLSARFELIAGRIGIDLLMRFHQLMARTALAFLLLHAALYLVPLLVAGRGWGRRRVLEASQSAEFYAGVAAIVLLLALVVLALRRRRLPIRYEVWRGLHGVLGTAVLVLGAWHAVGLGRYASHDAVRLLLLGFIAIAVGSLVYVYLIKPLRMLARPWRVVSNQPVGRGLWELAVEPAGPHRLDFAAGQFAWVNFRRWPLSLLDHPFSIASAPEQGPQVAFVIQEAGDFTRRIGEIEAGHRVYLDAPHGAFTLAGRDAEGIGLIAGGVGIAPILSLLRHLRAARDPRPVRLLYGAGGDDRLIAREEIEAMRAELNLEVNIVLAEASPDWAGRSGVLDADVVRGWLTMEQPERWLFLMCGPTAMMQAVEAALQQAGVPLSRIIYERFAFD
jgi:predicted ferric reductase